MFKQLRVLSVSAALPLLSAVTLQAQNTAYPPYIIDVKTEISFAQSEINATTYRPGFDNIPHLDPVGVANAMTNLSYMETGPGHFSFVIAHRGSHSLPGCAENSACGIAQAYAAGSDAIELDAKVSADGEAVLGHDVAVARELNNWVNSSNMPVNRSSWTPFTGFPAMDPTYQDLSKYPFFTNFKRTDSNGNTIVDPYNPTRSTMNVAQFQNGVMLDTYDEPTSNHQLTLFEALYIVQKQFPMMIWLDVKSADDLSAVASAIQTARTQLGNTGALQNIGLKITFGTLAKLPVAFNPGGTMDLAGIKYLMVFGTGDLDTMATYNGQAAPTNPTAATQNIFYTIRQNCQYSNNGCLGVELSHKDPNAPTLGIYNTLVSAVNNYNLALQVAAFQTVPQYSWYWQQLAGDLKTQQAVFNRTFPRTDGSCCFALEDALNASAVYAGSETEDLRNLYSWNEQNFTLITTDEPALVLRDLYAQGKRPTQVATAIGGTNTTVPSGGNPSDLGTYRDGLYKITNVGLGLNLAVTSNNQLTVANPLAGDRSQYWYLVSAGTGHGGSYYLINAQSGTALTQFGANPGLNIPQDSDYFPWLVTSYSFIEPVAASGIVNLGWDNGTLVLSTGLGRTSQWNLSPVATPASELSQQQAGPPGYTYCADEGSSCDFGSTYGSMAFGANGSFRFLPFVTGMQSCSLSNFSNIDPAAGVKEACFIASYRTNNVTTSYYSLTSGGFAEGTSLAAGTYAFGAVSSTNQAGLFTYKALPKGGTCSVSSFGYDPAFYVAKECYSLNGGTPAAPSEFVPCSQEGQVCSFSGPAVVAFGDIRNSTSYLTYRQATNGIDCSRTSFGMDPDYGVKKACFYLAGTPDGYVTSTGLSQTVWQSCGQEGNTCTVPLGYRMAIGLPNGPQFSFVTATAANTTNQTGAPASASFTCEVAAFPTDPAKNQTKTCYYTAQLLTFRGPAGYSLCANLNGTCQFTGTANVAYGADGHFIFRPGQTNSIACNLDSFGGGADPYPNVVKACYYKLY